MPYFPIIMSGLNIDDAAAVRPPIVLNIILIAIILLWFVIRIIVPLATLAPGRKVKTGSCRNPYRGTAVTGLDTEAAIATALYLYFNDMHDEESDVITMKRVSRTYSPWSSKFYSMRNLR